jgi:hypothetical protein
MYIKNQYIYKYIYIYIYKYIYIYICTYPRGVGYATVRGDDMDSSGCSSVRYILSIEVAIQAPHRLGIRQARGGSILWSKTSNLLSAHAPYAPQADDPLPMLTPPGSIISSENH